MRLKLTIIASTILMASCTQKQSKLQQNNNLDSLSNDSLTTIIIRLKDSIAQLPINIQPDTEYNTNLIDSIILQFNY